MEKILFSFVMIVHGLIHLLGFVKAYDLTSVELLTDDISKTSGLFWLLAGMLFLITAFLYYMQDDAWWFVGLATVIISQVLITLSWNDAKAGTIANVIIAIPILKSIPIG